MSLNKEEEINKLIDHLFREEYGKVVSYLTSKIRFPFSRNSSGYNSGHLSRGLQKLEFPWFTRKTSCLDIHCGKK